MSPMDILFWMLVVLMGGVAWAAEAGLGQRYRNSMASSMLAALGSAIMIMFWVDDATKIEFDKTKTAAKKGEGGSERGSQQGEKQGGDKQSGSGSGNGTGKEEPSKPGSGAKRDDDAEPPHKAATDEDNGIVEYSRVPFKDCPVCPDMIILPKGVTQLGSPLDEPGRGQNERVAQPVPVAHPFAIGRLEISRGEYAAFAKEISYESPTQCDLGKRRGRFNWKAAGFEQDDRHPAVCLSMNDVSVYLAWLTATTKRNYRLPTEVEWEYAARGDTTTPYWRGASLTRHEANLGRARDGTTGGGTFGRNKFGLSDLSGNAWEMIADCAPEPETPVGAPPEQRPCRRWIKGGGWNSPADTGRHAARALHLDGTALNYVGFRVARSIDERDDHKILSREQKKAIAQAEAEAAAIAAKEQELDAAARQEANAKRENDQAAAKIAAEVKAVAAKAAAAKAADAKAAEIRAAEAKIAEARAAEAKAAEAKAKAAKK